MWLVYCLIACSGKTLVEYSPYSGNFPLTAQEILARSQSANKRAKYATQQYLFYLLHNANTQLLLMCDHRYSERLAFAFLDSLAAQFSSKFTQQQTETMSAHGGESFRRQMVALFELYDAPQKIDTVTQLGKETEQINELLNEDLQKLLDREASIEILVQKTETMAALSTDMATTSRAIREEATWCNRRMKIIIALSAPVIVYFILVASCGGFNLHNCF